MAKNKVKYYTHRGVLYREDSHGRKPYYGNQATNPNQSFQKPTSEDLKADYPKPQTAWWQGIAADPSNQAAATGIYLDKDPRTVDNAALKPGEYYNSSAINQLQNPQSWREDPNLSIMSKQAQGMLDTRNDRGGPNLTTGPGQAFNPGQLASLYAMGMQNLGQQNRSFSAGVAGANAGRGTVGVNPSAMLHSQNAAQNRAALAQGNIDAQMKGLDLGVQQYAQKRATFEQLSNLGNQSAQRGLETQKLDYAGRLADKNYAQDQATRAQQAVDDFVSRNAAQLSVTSGGDNGDQLKEHYRRILQGLTHNRDVWQSNLSRYA